MTDQCRKPAQDVDLLRNYTDPSGSWVLDVGLFIDRMHLVSLDWLLLPSDKDRSYSVRHLPRSLPCVSPRRRRAYVPPRIE
jgi:hypothetical protein